MDMIEKIENGIRMYEMMSLFYNEVLSKYHNRAIREGLLDQMSNEFNHIESAGFYFFSDLNGYLESPSPSRDQILDKGYSIIMDLANSDQAELSALYNTLRSIVLEELGSQNHSVGYLSGINQVHNGINGRLDSIMDANVSNSIQKLDDIIETNIDSNPMLHLSGFWWPYGSEWIKVAKANNGGMGIDYHLWKTNQAGFGSSFLYEGTRATSDRDFLSFNHVGVSTHEDLYNVLEDLHNYENSNIMKVRKSIETNISTWITTIVSDDDYSLTKDSTVSELLSKLELELSKETTSEIDNDGIENPIYSERWENLFYLKTELLKKQNIIDDVLNYYEQSGIASWVPNPIYGSVYLEKLGHYVTWCNVTAAAIVKEYTGDNIYYNSSGQQLSADGQYADLQSREGWVELTNFKDAYQLANIIATPVLVVSEAQPHITLLQPGIMEGEYDESKLMVYGGGLALTGPLITPLRPTFEHNDLKIFAYEEDYIQYRDIIETNVLPDYIENGDSRIIDQSYYNEK